MANIKQQSRQSTAAEAASHQTGAIPDDASKRTGYVPAQDGPAGSHIARSSSNAMQQAAGHAEEAGHKLSEAAQQAAEGVRMFMALPAAASGGLLQVHQAMTGLVGSVFQANLRLAQGMFRAINPGAFIDLQQHCVREHVSAFTESGASIVRAARHAANEALHPLEAHLEQRRQQQQGDQRGQQHSRRVADVMSPGVRVASPDDTVQQAAQIMHEENTGVLPVGEDDRLVGMVTDHDIATLVAEARDPAHTKVREVMAPEVRYVFEDEDPHHAAANMAEQHVVRLPVLSRRKRLVGVVSLGDLAAEDRIPSAAAHAPGGRTPKGFHSEAAAE